MKIRKLFSIACTSLLLASLATLAATIGSVRTQGPAAPGFTNSPVRIYAPAGYNPIYATWEATATDNRVDLTLTPAAGQPICNPIFRIFGYTAPAIPAISLDGQPGIPDSDCFVTLDVARSELWITVNRKVAAPLRIGVQ